MSIDYSLNHSKNLCNSHSDREMEKAVRENLAIRWFCGFGLTEHTPDYSYFSKLRKRLGTKRVANLFNEVNATLGHKRHAAVDMRHGLVKKVAVTAANVPDFKAAQHVVPKEGAVFLDKIYDTKKTDGMLQARLLHPATIRKNNNPIKNRDLDRWRSAIRMPFEGTFSKMNKRARYRGHEKVALQCFLEAIIYNLKKSVRLLFAPKALATI